MNISYFVHRGICIFFYGNAVPFHFQTKITHPRYGSPYPWPLNRILSYQKQWEVRRKMKAIGWAGKTLDQVSVKSDGYFFTMLVWFILFILLFCFILFFLRFGELDVLKKYILYLKHYLESCICLHVFAFSSNKS